MSTSASAGFQQLLGIGIAALQYSLGQAVRGEDDRDVGAGRELRELGLDTIGDRLPERAGADATRRCAPSRWWCRASLAPPRRTRSTRRRSSRVVRREDEPHRP